jgi:hypothetical protein
VVIGTPRAALEPRRAESGRRVSRIWAAKAGLFRVENARVRC